MSILILRSIKDNNYYVEVDGIIRGSFHSIAEIETAKHNKKWGKEAKSQSLLDYHLIRELYIDS